MTKIDWKSLAYQVGAISARGEFGGKEYARQALSVILGDKEVIAAVHHFISLQSGAELARNVLALLKPRAAMQECYRIFQESSDIEERQLAVALLASIGDHSVLPWLDEFLDHPDSIVQSWGASVLLELVFENQVEEEEIENLIAKCGRHPNYKVRELAESIREEYGRGARTPGESV